MSTIEPGWYKDPAEPTTRRYWDGEGWLGDPIPVDSTPPPGPPPAPAPAVPPAPAPPSLPSLPATLPSPAAGLPGVPGPPSGPQPGWIAVPPGYLLMAEPRPHGLMLAGAGSRFAARLVDVLAVLLLCAIANFWFAVEFWHDIQPYATGFMEVATRGDTGAAQTVPVPPESAQWLLIAMSMVATAVWFAYEVPASANSGQTLGKRLLGIKVVRVESEERLGFGRSFRRWGRLGLPTLFWALCCGLTFVLQAIDCLFVVIDRPLRQALHDKSAATVVIQVPRASRPETAQRKTQSVTSGGHHADPR